MYTIGCDPEVFFSINGEVISAIGLVGGSKYKPLSIDDKGNMVQEDNIAAEFNIPPCRDSKSFRENINICLNYLSKIAENNNSELSKLASSDVHKMWLRSKKAREFGCDPDYNVYLKQVNESPRPPINFRCCGGHIAVGGYDNSSIENTERIVKSMDLILGVESVLLDPDTDRKKLYGKAGSFRFKDFGLEYRTLSNFWIMSDELIEWAFNKTIEAIEFSNSEEFNKVNWDEVVECINTSNKEIAQRIMSYKLKTV